MSVLLQMEWHNPNLISKFRFGSVEWLLVELNAYSTLIFHMGHHDDNDEITFYLFYSII